MATKVVKEEVIRVRVDKDLKDRLKKMCKNKKINMSEMITFMIENEVKSYKFRYQCHQNKKVLIEQYQLIPF